MTRVDDSTKRRWCQIAEPVVAWQDRAQVPGSSGGERCFCQSAQPVYPAAASQTTAKISSRNGLSESGLPVAAAAAFVGVGGGAVVAVGSGTFVAGAGTVSVGRAVSVGMGVSVGRGVSVAGGTSVGVALGSGVGVSVCAGIGVALGLVVGAGVGATTPKHASSQKDTLCRTANSGWPLVYTVI